MGDHSLRHHYVVVIVVDTVNLIVPKMVNAASSMANKLIGLWSSIVPYTVILSRQHLPAGERMRIWLGVPDLFFFVVSASNS